MQSWVYSQEFLCFSSSTKKIKDSLIWGREVVWLRTPSFTLLAPKIILRKFDR